MIFFVLMYAISKTDEQKFQQLALAMTKAFHGGAILNNTGSGLQQDTLAPKPTIKVTDQNTQKLNDLYNQVKSFIQAHHLQQNVTITNETQGVRITLRDVVLFDTGQADIKPDAKNFLNGLVPFFQKLNNPIVIEGYTDNTPINTPLFRSNWELSSARAVNVVEYLGSKGINPSRLSGEAFGEYHPVAPNDSETNKQKNRRINIVVIRDGQSTN